MLFNSFHFLVFFLVVTSLYFVLPYNKRWLGVGAKSGGQLLFGGVESTSARLWNLNDGESLILKLLVLAGV